MYGSCLCSCATDSVAGKNGEVKFNIGLRSMKRWILRKMKLIRSAFILWDSGMEWNLRYLFFLNATFKKKNICGLMAISNDCTLKNLRISTPDYKIESSEVTDGANRASV